MVIMESNPSTLFASARRSCGSCLASILCAFLCALPVFASAQIPRGVFSLSSTGKACSATMLANPDVTGVSIRYAWASLEPTEGVYNWSFLDSEVARVAAAGKEALLRIGTQADKPAWVTTAVTNAGGTFFTFKIGNVTTTIPVFWD